VVAVIRETLVATGEHAERQARDSAASVAARNADGTAAAKALNARADGLLTAIRPNAPLPSFLAREKDSWRRAEEALFDMVKRSLDSHEATLRGCRVALTAVMLEANEGQRLAIELEEEAGRILVTEERIDGLRLTATDLVRSMGDIPQQLGDALREVTG
jgi:hypothetical protein